MLLKLIIALNSFAYAYPSQLKLWKDDKYIPVVIKEHQGLHLSDVCLKKSPANCDAFNATKVVTTASATRTGTVGHPASRYCHDKNGVVRILISNDNKQYDFCLFKDGSMIDSWELYYKHFPKEVIK